MQLVQWIHKIAKANSMMYPGYKDKLYLTKLFLNTVILSNETSEYGKLFQIYTAWEKKEKYKEFVGVWGWRSVRGWVYLVK